MSWQVINPEPDWGRHSIRVKAGCSFRAGRSVQFFGFGKRLFVRSPRAAAKQTSGTAFQFDFAAKQQACQKAHYMPSPFSFLKSMQGQPFWGFSCQLWISRVASTGARTALPILYEPSPHPVWRQSEPTADAEDGCRFTVDSQLRFVPVEINGGAQYFDLFTVVAFIDAHHTASLAAQLIHAVAIFIPFSFSNCQSNSSCHDVANGRIFPCLS